MEPDEIGTANSVRRKSSTGCGECSTSALLKGSDGILSADVWNRETSSARTAKRGGAGVL